MAPQEILNTNKPAAIRSSSTAGGQIGGAGVFELSENELINECLRISYDLRAACSSDYQVFGGVSARKAKPEVNPSEVPIISYGVPQELNVTGALPIEDLQSASAIGIYEQCSNTNVEEICGHLMPKADPTLGPVAIQTSRSVASERSSGLIYG